MKKKTQEEFIKQVHEQNPDVQILGDYVNYGTKVKVRYLRCGHIVEASPQGLLHGHGCSLCANNTRKTKEQFATELQKVNPNVEVIGQYIDAKTPIEIRCRLCGYTWDAKPNRLFRGFQCMNCVRPHTSFMEQFILLTFRQVIGENKVLNRNKSAIGKELDIYIPDYKYAIEPGTWLYHKNNTKSDLLKRELCSAKGIRLITIYDTFPQGQPAPFQDDCYVYDGFLNEAGYERLISLIGTLLADIGYDTSFVEWDKIADRAYLNCHWNADREFAEKLKEIMPEMEILEQYKGSGIPILVNKTTCNHAAWRARPYTLLKGIGCPQCGREIAAANKTRSPKEFVDEMKSISPTITILGAYTKITDHILVECKICGKQWNPVCYSLLQGKGCPHCSAIKGSKKSHGKTGTKDKDLFKQQMSEINPNIEIIGEYVNNKTKIAVKCLKCGHEWQVVPQSIYNGHGCPKCARKRTFP